MLSFLSDLPFDADVRLRQVLATFWVCSLALILTAWVFPSVAEIGSYGLRGSANLRIPNHVAVPARTGWIFMYTVGLGASLAAVLGSVRHLGVGGSPLALFALLVQVCRRLFEAVFVHRHGSRPLNPLVLFGGSCFYVAASLSIVSDRKVAVTFAGVTTLSNVLSAGLAVELFGVASILQHKAHKALAGVKPLKGKYGVARGGLFELVCCPHYTAEIVVYASIFALCPGKLVVLMFLFVAGNLCHSALVTAKWYRETFASHQLPPNRRAIFPGVL